MVYQEIIEGCSYSPKGFFIKHLCEIEQIELTRKRIELVNDYVARGIPTEEERLTRLKEDGEWSDEKENDIVAYRQTLSDNERLIHTIIQQQQAGIRKVIEEHRQSLIKLLIERKTAIGITAEELTQKDSTYFMAYLALYRDRACLKPLFDSWEDFEALEEDKSTDYLQAIDNVLDRMNEQNIRKISVMPFFLNAFSYCKESIHTFLNKPISRLTNYQVHLFSLGSRNLNILSQSEGSPPDYFDKVSVDDILKWYDLQYSIIIGKRKQANH